MGVQESGFARVSTRFGLRRGTYLDYLLAPLAWKLVNDPFLLLFLKLKGTLLDIFQDLLRLCQHQRKIEITFTEAVKGTSEKLFIPFHF